MSARKTTTPLGKLVVCCLTMLCITVQSLHAQTFTIKGRVINYFTNEVMPFASVKWKLAGNGVLTDSIGQFTIRKNNTQTDTLVVSYIGFEEVYRPINPKKILPKLSLLFRR